MSQQFDEFSKSLAEDSLPRRESLKRLGAVFAGAIFGSLGLNKAVAGRNNDPCKSFCHCRYESQQSQCIATCRACDNDTSRILGKCGSYYCCSNGVCEDSFLGRYCTDLDRDPYNCGECGYACERPGPYEYSACVEGRCEYGCAEGAAFCDGACTPLAWDPDNCGECGYMCGGSTPYCNQGRCSKCRPGTDDCYGTGVCHDLTFDALNCGGCGIRCSITPSETCYAGVCVETEPCWDCGY